jgi:glycosyltransferase involved in cell wall biosynthesis
MTPAFNPSNGGVQNTTFKLGREFFKRGHDVHYFSFQNEGHIKVEFGSIHYVESNKGTNDLINQELLTNLIIKIQPEFVINQMPYDDGIQKAIANAKSKHNFISLGCLRNSLFSVVSNLESYCKTALPNGLKFLSKSKLVQSILLTRHKNSQANSLKKILKNHDKFILLAPPNVEEMKYFLGDFDQTKIFTIPNSIPEVSSDFSKKEKVILHVGRLNYVQKRSDLIIPFWEKLCERLPDWSFEIVGYGEFQGIIEKQLKEKNLPRVRFHGKQNPNEFYQRAKIFMMPSAYEGFPNTLIEAQSYGCIPFCFDNYPALKWIANHDQDAFLIKPFDLDKMVDSINEIANSTEKINFHSKKAILNAQRFTTYEVVNLWESKFQELIPSEK